MARYFTVSILLVGLGFPLLQANGQSPEFRGIWVDAWHPGFKTSHEVHQLVADVRLANFNAILAQVRRRGDAFYNDSPYEPKTADTNVVPPDFDSLAELIKQAHDTQAGPRLEIHAWLTMYPVATTVKPSDPKHVFNAYPEWLSETYTGAKFDGVERAYWLDPGHPEVQRHLCNVALDIVTRFDVDGIALDYLRYPSRDWGYNPTTITRFNVRYHRTGKPSRTDPEWLQFRRDQVTELMRKIYLSVMAAKPRVKVSVAGIAFAPGISSTTEWTNSAPYQRALQDWRAWTEEGIVDFVAPLIFFRQHRPQHAEDFAKWSAFAKGHRYHRHMVISTANYMNHLTNALAQVLSTRQPGPRGERADGVCVYSYDKLAEDDVGRVTALAALGRSSNAERSAEGIFPQPVTTPVMPWKDSPTAGHLMGTVAGGNTNVLDGVTITISGPVPRLATSDATGFYGAVDLPPGSYTVVGRATGFVNQTNTVIIEQGRVTTGNFILRPSAP